jgi:hypothetical protein
LSGPTICSQSEAARTNRWTQSTRAFAPRSGANQLFYGSGYLVIRNDLRKKFNKDIIKFLFNCLFIYLFCSISFNAIFKPFDQLLIILISLNLFVIY